MLDNVKDELDAFRKHVITEAKKNLTRNKKNASKELYNSLSSSLRVSKNSFELSFEMADYGNYVDQGVSGRFRKFKTPYSFKDKMPPSQVFEKWIKQKGIKGRNDKGQFIKTKSLSYLIARSIYNKGMKPSLFFTRPFELGFKRLGDDIIEAFGLDIDEFLQYTLNRKR